MCNDSSQVIGEHILRGEKSHIKSLIHPGGTIMVRGGLSTAGKGRQVRFK